MPHGSTLWPILHFTDPDRALELFLGLGFAEAVVGRDPDGDLAHVELEWPGGGVFVFGSTKHTEGVHADLSPGTSAFYVIADDLDAVHERARTAGAEVVEEPRETTFGSGATSRVLTVRDTEGNLWTFGTYRGSR